MYPVLLAVSMLLGGLMLPGWTAASTFPASDRSNAAEARQRANLEQRLSAQGLSLGAPIFIRVFKEERSLEIWVAKAELAADQTGDRALRYERFATLPICDFSGGLGPKIREGDQQSPKVINTMNNTAQ